MTVDSHEVASHQSETAQRRRLRWRSRRGLLENDLVLTRFLDQHEMSMSDLEVNGYHQLLDLTDNELLDLILSRTEPNPDMDRPEIQRVLQMIRAV
ncbi:MAG: succinate dehydrogenase assembly factor 2 [Burkholderiaceae bacterium]